MPEGPEDRYSVQYKRPDRYEPQQETSLAQPADFTRLT